MESVEVPVEVSYPQKKHFRSRAHCNPLRVARRHELKLNKLACAHRGKLPGEVVETTQLYTSEPYLKIPARIIRSRVVFSLVCIVPRRRSSNHDGIFYPSSPETMDWSDPPCHAICVLKRKEKK